MSTNLAHNAADPAQPDPPREADFERNGYVLLGGLFDADAARRLRAYVEAQFAPECAGRPTDIVNHPSLGSIRMDVFNRFPEIHRRIFFQTDFASRLKILLGGDFVVIPDTAIHRNSFGGWHKDSRAQQVAGHHFHWEPDFRIVTIGLYLQPNTVEYGGGLEVLPGSHSIKFPQYPPQTRGHLVPSDAGDALVFNHNLDHKASWPAGAVPPERTKFSIFLSASRNNRHVTEYMKFLKTRPDYAWIRDYRYPEELVRHARLEGYGLAV